MLQLEELWLLRCTAKGVEDWELRLWREGGRFGTPYWWMVWDYIELTFGLALLVLRRLSGRRGGGVWECGGWGHERKECNRIVLCSGFFLDDSIRMAWLLVEMKAVLRWREWAIFTFLLAFHTSYFDNIIGQKIWDEIPFMKVVPWLWEMRMYLSGVLFMSWCCSISGLCPASSWDIFDKPSSCSPDHVSRLPQRNVVSYDSGILVTWKSPVPLRSLQFLSKMAWYIESSPSSQITCSF